MAYFKYNGTLGLTTSTPGKQFYGTDGKDTLSGGSGAEALWGGSGDVLSGGGGDDTYYLKTPSDLAIESAGGGVDRIVTWMSLDLAKFSEIENLAVSGNGLFARGNALDNIIEGGGGSQEIYGGEGLDILIGGGGRDTFVVIKGEGSDVIADFNITDDKIRLTSHLKTFDEVRSAASQRGGDVHIDLGPGEGLLLKNTALDQLGAHHFDLKAQINSNPTPAPTPTPTPAPSPGDAAAATKYDGSLASLTRAPDKQVYGSAGQDTLTGGSGADGLWGGAGDRLIGGAGDDTYYLKLPSDTLVEAAGGGTDRIVSWMSVDLAKFGHVENLSVSGQGLYARGNSLDNIIEGGGGAQEIYGGLGQDVLLGGGGGDTFVIKAGEGSDVIVDFDLSQDTVRLTSNLSTFAQLKASASQRGADTHLDLGGGEGLLLKNVNLASLADHHFDLGGAASPGASTPLPPAPPVIPPVALPPAPAPVGPVTAPTAPPPPVSNLPPAGAPTSTAAPTTSPTHHLYGLNGKADTLVGGDTPDSLWGGDSDRLIGGQGDDTYYLKSPRDVVIEYADQGSDQIIAWQNVDLSDHPNIENLSVSGDGLYAAGNDSANIIKGGGGSQQIYGGKGDDVLSGGGGADIFIFRQGEGSDRITDFDAKEDVVRLSANLHSFEALAGRLSQQGDDVRLSLGGGESLTFQDLRVEDLSAQNFQLQFDPSKLGPTTFADEFDGALSIWDKESNPTGVWRPDYGYQGTNGVGSYTLTNNGEKQIYVSPYFRGHNGDFGESPFVTNSDGTLSIWAQPSNNAEIYGFGYTSGLITTKESFSQTYGYFEMRADVPDAAGAWPAFWMLPKTGAWPPEIDIMEVLSKDAQVTHTTQHSSIGGHKIDGAAQYTPETDDGMHTYGLLWTKSDLVWFVDQVEVFRSDTPADMHQPMFLLANLALGGWGGGVDSGALPAEFKIDYIRAYDVPDDGWVM